MKYHSTLALACKAAACTLLLWALPMRAANLDAINTTTVTAKQGKIIGAVKNDVAIFYDIPYAKNPFIEGRRFQAPQPYGNWDNTLDATKIGLPVPQPSRGRTINLVGAPGDLTLNIWMPATSAINQHKLPVMVWIPGGAFIREDAAEQVYDGSSFAKDDVIVVTVNYRVGVDGFMHLQGAPDNRGILDQILALQWVQENIADFGGDPKQVTLFGQSAGAESVAILLGTSKAEGLFQKAIMQSPPMQSVTQSEATRIANVFADNLNVPATIEGISTIAYPQLVSSVIEMGKTISNRDQWGMLSWGGTAFLPVVDNDIIVGSPMKSLASNANSSIPTIVGSTDQEARLYLVPSGAIDNIPNEQVSLLLSDLSLNGDAQEAYQQKSSNHSAGEMFVNIQSDYTFRMPALHIADHLVTNGNNVWHYNFSWSSPAFAGRLGAAHFVDVPFVFNTIASDEASAFVGSNPPNVLAQAMHREWTRFAKSGTVSWTPYNLRSRPTMIFDSTSVQVSSPEQDVSALWQQYTY